MNLYSPVISGSLTVTGSTSFIGNVTMTGTVSATASNAELLSGTGSVGFTTTGSFTAMSGSVSSRVSQIETVYATTGSNSFRATQSITGSLTVTGQITAQTLNVQQVTSSIVYSSGSNVFGCDINSRQTFTGSFYQTGSNMNINAGCVIIGNSVSPACDFYFNVTTVCAGTNATIAQFYNAEYTSGTRGFIRIRNSANIGGTTSAYIGQGQDSKTYIYNNDPSRPGDIVITGAGLVGIGTCAPISQLTIAASNCTTAGNICTALTLAGIRLFPISGTTNGLSIGIAGANTNYLQAQYSGDCAPAPISLQPYGGNMGIGTIDIVSTCLCGSLTIRKSYQGDTSNGSTTQNYYVNQSALYLFGRNSGLSIIANNGEEGEIIFGNNSTRAYARIATGTGTTSTGGDMYFKVGGDTERLRISGNCIGINNSNPRSALEINQACSDQNNGGFMFRTLDLPDNTWTTFFTPPANWGGITTLTWVGTNDHNRSGAAQIRWSYQNCSAALGPTTTIFNDSQNAPGYFRYSGGNLQICVDGAGAGKRLQVLIQGSRGA